MKINREDKKLQIRKKDKMTLHRVDVGDSKGAMPSAKAKAGDAKASMLKDAKSVKQSNKVKIQTRKKKQADRSVSSHKGKDSLKKNLLVSGIVRKAQRSNTGLEGEREIKEALAIGEVAANNATKIKKVIKVKKKSSVKNSKMNIKKVDNLKSIRKKKARASAVSKAGTSKKAVGARKMGSTRFRVTTFISGFIKKQQEKRAASEAIDVIKAIQNYLLAGAVGLIMNIVLVALPIMLIIALLYNSPLALALPPLDDSDERIQSVLAGYYQDFNSDLAARSQSSGVSVTYANGDNSLSNFRDVLMVYMVKYYTGTGEIGTVVTDESKANLKEVFDVMNNFEEEVTTHTIQAGESLGVVVTSGYCNCAICCGQWAGGPTASGVMPTANHTIAVDRSAPLVPMGTKIIFNGITYTVEDTGPLTEHGVDFDVYCADHTTASNWGHQSFEAFLADGEENEVEVTNQSLNVYQMTYEDYIALGILTEEQEEILREMMTSDIWDDFSDGTAGAMVVAEAMTKIGCAYSQANRYAEGSYDCSSFIFRLFRDVAGITLPEISADQGKYCVDNGLTVTQDMLQPGDLIFYSYEQNGRFMNISHVAIYAGDGMMVHAANPSRGVVYDPMSPSNINLYGRVY